DLAGPQLLAHEIVQQCREALRAAISCDADADVHGRAHAGVPSRRRAARHAVLISWRARNTFHPSSPSAVQLQSIDAPWPSAISRASTMKKSRRMRWNEVSGQLLLPL